jgi:uncharacterized protein YegP (UPF0339 family)
METKIEVYEDAQGKFRWRALRAGRIVADSGEGYARKITVLREIDRLFTNGRKLVFKDKSGKVTKIQPEAVAA